MIEIQNISKSFGTLQALKNVSIVVDQGTFLTIVGPSGCGKTTLLKIIAGFDSPDEGHILIDGQSSENLPPHRRSIGMVFQKLALFPHMNASQNIAYPLKMRKFPKQDIPEIVQHYLKLVRLEGLGDRRIHELSGGQQQRIAIARALSFSPDVLLLDEPLSALDKKLQEEMQLEFRRIQQELGITTINVTHNQKEALVMSDHIVVMNEAQVEQHDKPTAVYQKPQTLFVANFIGLSNTFQAHIQSIDQTCIRFNAFQTEMKSTNLLKNVQAGDPLFCNIKAENLHIVTGEDSTQNQPFDNVWQGLVEQMIFEGDRIVYKISACGQSLSVLLHHQHTLLEIGASVQLGCHAKDIHLFPLLSKEGAVT